LPSVYLGFEEPYRTIAATLLEATRDGGFADRLTVGAALEGRRLYRRRPDGSTEDLTAQQAVNLVWAGRVEAIQAAAYVPVVAAQLDARRHADRRERAEDLVRDHGDDLARLMREFEALAAQTRRDTEAVSSEAMQFFPYFHQLIQIQRGTQFLGLDSGFPLLNQVANGLDTGLFVWAARPSLGKTTLAWQVCQQVAEINKVPALFVSLEQSKRELRAKALARLARMDSRFIARGRLRSDDAEDVTRLREAGERYFSMAPYLTIIEGDDTTSVDQIGEVAAARMARSGSKRCFVVVDYLQILPVRQADAGRAISTKDKVDLHVSALRRLARQLDSPVLAISSENRVGYERKKIDVFKESGGIEYSADIAVVLTLDQVATCAAAGQYRMVDMNIVKNRNGELAVLKYKFYPERAEFVESGRGESPVDVGG
jgi:replicative DNA helicase